VQNTPNLETVNNIIFWQNKLQDSLLQEKQK